MDRLGDAARQKFRESQADAHDMYAKKPMIWQRFTANLDQFNEGTSTKQADVPLLVLCNYNYMRTWPITASTESGQLDRQSIQVLLFKDYLRNLGYINAGGYFDYNPDIDRFILDGLVHNAVGDTPVAQNGDDDLWITIILKREETPTGTIR